MITLSPTQHADARIAADRALGFLELRGATLPYAMVRYQWFGGSAFDVATALVAYQNPDGGFGSRLEPDIHDPSSNAFAARIAMQFMRALPAEVTNDVRARLQAWLTANQHEDGDWHFSEQTTAGFLQPWFAGWGFPSLNPACCVVGLAASLGIATDTMLARTASLFAEKASTDEIRAAQFYSVLPYVEYTAGITPPDATIWYDLLAEQIVAMIDAGKFDDAEHFFTLALGGSPEITARIPAETIAAQIDRMLSEQQTDGGWPTPYDDAWRDWSTVGNMMTLSDLREG